MSISRRSVQSIYIEDLLIIKWKRFSMIENGSFLLLDTDQLHIYLLNTMLSKAIYQHQARVFNATIWPYWTYNQNVSLFSSNLVFFSWTITTSMRQIWFIGNNVSYRSKTYVEKRQTQTFRSNSVHTFIFKKKCVHCLILCTCRNLQILTKSPSE